MRLLSEAVFFTRAYGLRKVVRRFANTYVSGQRRAYLVRSDYVSVAATPLPDAGLTFRFARAEDIPRFARETGFSAAVLQAWLKRNDFLYLAVRDGQPVAFRCDSIEVATPWIRPVLRLRPDQVFMVDIFTHPAFRRQGITRQIRVAMAREMLQRGYRSSWGLQQLLNREALAAFDRTPDMLERVALLTRTSVMGATRFGLAMCHPLSGPRIAHLLDMVGELVPVAKRVAVLFNPGTAVAHAAAIDSARREAASRRLELQFVGVTDSTDQAGVFRDAFELVRAGRPDALVVVDDALYRKCRRLIVDLVNQSRVPAVYERREYVVSGGLVCCPASGSGRVAVPPELSGVPLTLDPPDEAPAGPAVNMAAARALGLAIPTSLLERAERVPQGAADSFPSTSA